MEEGHGPRLVVSTSLCSIALLPLHRCLSHRRRTDCETPTMPQRSRPTTPPPPSADPRWSGRSCAQPGSDGAGRPPPRAGRTEPRSLGTRTASRRRPTQPSHTLSPCRRGPTPFQRRCPRHESRLISSTTATAMVPTRRAQQRSRLRSFGESTAAFSPSWSSANACRVECTIEANGRKAF